MVDEGRHGNALPELETRDAAVQLPRLPDKTKGSTAMKGDIRQRTRKIGVHSMEVDCVVRVESKAWVMVRNAKFPHAAPFVISRKEWESLPPAEEWRLK